MTPSPLSRLLSKPRINGWEWHFRAAGPLRSAALRQELPASDRRTPKMARVEAVLLVSDGAIAWRKLAQLATLADAAEAQTLVRRLNESYDRTGCAFRVEQVASGCRLLTRPRFAIWLDRLHHRAARARLSPPMLETLAVVAYRQPVTRADVEKLRGVQSSEMLKQLMERGLLRITGEEDSLGRPFLYGTTRQFLEEFGFGDIEELPGADLLRPARPAATGSENADPTLPWPAENEAA